MPIDIKQLMALLQQGAPQQGAVKPAGGVGDQPQIPQLPDSMVPMDMRANTVRPPGYVDPKANPIEALLGSMPAQKPAQPDIRAQLSSRMPTTQGGPKPMPMKGAPVIDFPGMEQIFGSHSLGEEDSALGKLGNLFPTNEPLAKPPATSTRMLSPGQGAQPEPQAAPQGAQQAGGGAQGLQEAANEVVQSGADTPEKADDILRNEFQDDPEIESAIADAKQRYEIARARSAKPPGVMEYVGYVLSTLVGANPMQAAEAISRRGEKREDEHRALQDLLGAQGMKIRDRQGQRQMGVEQAQGEQKQNFDRLKAGRGAALQRMNQLQQAVNMSNNPAEKKALQQELDNMRRRTQFFGRQLGEPEVDEQGQPMSAASPDAMRLLGLG